MRVLLLGPTEVGEGMALSPRDRAVLCALGVKAGESASADRLADALWADDVPKSATKVVQGAIVRLRRLLGSSAIETTTIGYRLSLPEGELDTAEFERLVRRGQDFAALNEPERAATTLRQALSLWRGEPFADLAEWEPARVEATRLRDLRADAEDDLIAARLAAGQAGEAAILARSLVAENPFRESRWGLLATALYRTGRQQEALEAIRRARQTLADELGLDLGPGLTELESRILQQDPSLIGVPTRSAGGLTCPYKGLRAYGTEDSDFFFGRDGAIDEAVARLARNPLLLVVGPSGSGKSSFVRAGVAPRLARAGLEVVVIEPGVSPTATLSAGLAGAAHPVVVIDQLEELFASPSAAEQAEGFLDRLAGLAESGTPVIGTLRADYLGELSSSARIRPLAEAGMMLLAPPDELGIRDAIELPAREVGLILEPGLVDLLVRDVLDEPGGLPLMSHALVETWERRDGSVLTVEGYSRTGGIRGAVAQSAERVYQSLSPEDRQILRSVLLRLVVSQVNGEPVAARVPRRVFAHSADAQRVLDLLVRTRLVTATEETVAIAHESLVRAWPRFRSWTQEDVEGLRTLQHLQASAEGWDSLGRPEDELYRHARLQSVQEWRDRADPLLAPLEVEFIEASLAHDESARRAAEDQLRVQVRRNRQLRLALVSVVVLLISALLAGTLAARNGGEAAAAAKAAQAAAAAADAGRLGAIARNGGFYDVALLLAAQAEALHPSPAAESDLFATLLKGDSVMWARQSHRRVQWIDFSPDGSTLAVLTDPGGLEVWSADGALRSRVSGLDSAYPATAQPLALNADGTATLGGANGPYVVEAATGHVVAPSDRYCCSKWIVAEDGASALSDWVTSSGGPIPVLASWHRGSAAAQRLDLPGIVADLSPCGAKWACVTTEDGDLVRAAFDGSGLTRIPMLRKDVKAIKSIAASPDGSRLGAVGFDGVVRILDAKSGEVLHILSGASMDPGVMVFSPDGSRVALADQSTVRLWSTEGGHLPDRLEGHTGSVVALAFSPDGSALVSAAEDGSLVSWDLNGARRLGAVVTTALFASATPVRAQSSVDRIEDTSTLWATPRALVVGQFNGRVAFVDPTDGSVRRATASPAGAPIWTARSGGDGSRLVTADRDGHTMIWDVGSATSVGSVDLPPLEVEEFDASTWVSTDGRYGATIRSAAGPVVFDMASGEIVRQLPPLPTPTEDMYTIVQGWADHDTSLLVSRTAQDRTHGELLIVDATSGAVRLQLPLPDAWPEEVAPDPSGRFLALAMSNGTLRVIDPHDGHALAPPLPANAGTLTNVSVSPNGDYIAASAYPPRLTVWDTRTFRQVGTELPLDLDAYDARARFAPDGRLVVTSGSVMRTFDIDPKVWLERACREAGRVLTPDEFAEALPNRPYAPACSEVTPSAAASSAGTA